MKKILIVGIGSIGRRHIENFSNFFDIIDIADIQEDRVLKAKKDFKINNTFLDYKIAINSNKYDAIAITTPPHLHLEIATQAVHKNINLFIEKPLGISCLGWSDILDICDQKKLISYIAYCHRYIPYTKKFKEIIDSKKYGNILHANVRWGSYLPDWHPWEDYRSFYMAKKDQGGGALLDESHGIDLIRYLIGEPKGVYAQIRNISDLEITSDDTASLNLDFPKGELVHLNFDLTSRYPRISIEIICSKGTLIWDRIDHKIKIFDASTKEWKEINFTKDDLMSMYYLQAQNFYNCLTSKEKPKIDIKDALLTQKIIDASFDSSNKNMYISI